jgi:hypothetical protein
VDEPELWHKPFNAADYGRVVAALSKVGGYLMVCG